MNLARRLKLYLGLIYVVLTILCLERFKNEPLMFAGAEAVLLVLGIWGFLLLRQVFEPIKQLNAATQLLREESFTVKVREVGVPEVDQLIGVYNAMAERLRVERVHNQEQEYFLEKVLKTTQTAIVGFNYDGAMENINPAGERLFGLSAHTLLGKSLAQLNHPLARGLETLEVGASRMIPYQGRRRLKCEHAQFVDRGFYKTFMFIDELTHELRSSEKAAYGKLIRIMSHEINNSLGASSSLLHSLAHYGEQLKPEDREDYKIALDVVISRVDHLQTFMRDYTEVVKLPRPNRRAVHLGELLKRIGVLMDPELTRRRITWVWEPDPNFPTIHMDGNQMEQALLNIVKNAMEAIGEDGVIRLSTARENRPQLVVADSGSGFSQETASSLFTPFYTTKKDGQGIGLTLIAEILANHGFDYALENPENGVTHFTIWF